MTMGVIDAFRRLKVGSYLLKRMLDIISKMDNVLYVCLHVQTTNHQAVAFYQKHGFHIEKTVQGYYATNKIEPPDAYFLTRSNKDKF